MTQITTSAQTALPRTCEAADLTIWQREVDSTNTVARQLLTDGTLTDGTLSSSACIAAGTATGTSASVPMAVVASDVQTAGRGRLGRQWMARAGESSTITYATVIPESAATDTSVNGWLQMIAGLASLDAITQACNEVGAHPVHDGCQLMLKWPNDVFLHDHKLGGILAELVFLPSQVGILFGIGLNLGVSEDELPTALSTSLQMHRTPLPAVTELRDRIAALTVVSLRSRLHAFLADPRQQAARLHHDTQSVCWTLGRNVEARLTDGSTVYGVATSLNADASLTIRTDDGSLHIVRTGDVGVL